MYVTVSLDNGELVELLVRRRAFLQKLAHKIEGMSDAHVQKIPFLPKARKERIEDIEDRCRELMAKERHAAAVFVTFDKESHQRRALEIMQVGEINVVQNNCAILPKKYLFRGEHVLEVFEPAEPSAVRWDDLRFPLVVRIQQSMTEQCGTLPGRRANKRSDE